MAYASLGQGKAGLGGSRSLAKEKQALWSANRHLKRSKPCGPRSRNVGGMPEDESASFLGEKQGPAGGGPCDDVASVDAGYGIVFDPTLDTLLSMPVELYAFTAKYHVPELRPVSVYVDTPAFVICTSWSSVELERP